DTRRYRTRRAPLVRPAARAQRSSRCEEAGVAEALSDGHVDADARPVGALGGLDARAHPGWDGQAEDARAEHLVVQRHAARGDLELDLQDAEALGDDAARRPLLGSEDLVVKTAHPPPAVVGLHDAQRY